MVRSTAIPLDNTEDCKTNMLIWYTSIETGYGRNSKTMRDVVYNVQICVRIDHGSPLANADELVEEALGHLPEWAEVYDTSLLSDEDEDIANEEEDDE